MCASTSWTQLASLKICPRWRHPVLPGASCRRPRSPATGTRPRTACMTTFRRGDVVLVPFDFTDGSGTKWRPAVVVSDDRYNGAGPDVLIASITGNLAALPHVGDHQIGDWRAAGLLRPSLAQTKVAT